MKALRTLLKKLLPYSTRRNLLKFLSVLFDAHSSRSFSQEGEDMVLRRIFEDQQTGFYVDVGAHHPKLFSNTYFFYRRGWRGINIDANPGSMFFFQFVRPRDTNLEIAVSDTSQEIEFYIFNEPALNTVDKDLALRQQNDLYKISNTVIVEAKPLSTILEKYLPQNQAIDFLSIDIEDWDIRALKSNDWSRFRPKYVLIEDRYFDLGHPQNSEVYILMKDLNYKLYSKTVNTLIFQDADLDGRN
jgi:hypothetical protein